MDEVPSIPARMVNEFVYCPRLAYMEWVSGDFEHSEDTLMGSQLHRNVDRDGTPLPEPEDIFEGLRSTSVKLSDPDTGLIGVIDMVESDGEAVVPVDYKKGRAPKGDMVAWDADVAQMMAQVRILRANGYACDRAMVYYAGSNKRVEIEVTESEMSSLESAIQGIREMAAMPHAPPPLRDSNKCDGCSLAGICLPDEVNLMTGRLIDIDEDAVRRLHPARDDTLPMYVMEQGSRVGKKGENLSVTKGGATVGEARLMEISSLSTFGNISITSQALAELMDRGIPVCHFSRGGWFRGITSGFHHKNVGLRIAQYEIAASERMSSEIARRFILGKIANCRTLLRRNRKSDCDSALSVLNEIRKGVASCDSLEELRGMEGMAGRVYFMRFNDMLVGDESGFDFETRNRRPPNDPINAMLSYLYAILSKSMAVTLMAVGFDPYLGFLHRPRYGRMSLALDMMEEFRPIIADSTVIGLVNNGTVKESDFRVNGGACSLTSKGKKKLIGAYERRMDTLITHPVFGYRISYRRALEVQARLLSRYVMGEMDEYIPLMTR